MAGFGQRILMVVCLFLIGRKLSNPHPKSGSKFINNPIAPECYNPRLSNGHGDDASPDNKLAMPVSPTPPPEGEGTNESLRDFYVYWCRFMSVVLNFKSHLAELFAQALREVAPEVTPTEILIERPNLAAHGDYACNLAMQLAKPLRKPPRDIARALIAALPESDAIEKLEIAGAGFINVFITTAAKQHVVHGVLQAGAGYGHIHLGVGRKVGVEFVSANPTGPLHVGHGRGAAVGDCLCSVLHAAGWNVTREFYYNDAGVQIDNLTRSVQLRCKGITPDHPSWPEEGYRGDYIADVAEAYLAQETVEADDQHVTASGNANDAEAIRHFAVAYLRREQDIDLRAFGVNFDVFALESALYTDGKVDEAVSKLIASGHTYEQDDALWLRTTDFGDDKDRVMRKSDGSLHLFRPGRGLSPGQVAARFCPRDQRAGRGPSQHDHTGARRSAGAGCRHPQGLAGLRAAPDGDGFAQRPGGEDLQARRQLCHAARPDRRGGLRCDALFPRRAPPGFATGVRHRPGKIEEQREPGVLHPVCPCPHLRGAGTVGRRTQGLAAWPMSVCWTANTKRPCCSR